VADRFVKGDLGAALDGEVSVLVIDRAEATTVGTGMLRTEGLGLLIQENAEGALGQAGGGSSGDLLHGGEVEGAGLGEGTSCDDFSPFGGEFTDLLQLLLREFPLRHGPSSLALASISGSGFLFTVVSPCCLSCKLRPGLARKKRGKGPLTNSLAS
jgi:hypothetical protein